MTNRDFLIRALSVAGAAVAGVLLLWMISAGVMALLLPPVPPELREPPEPFLVSPPPPPPPPPPPADAVKRVLRTTPTTDFTVPGGVLGGVVGGVIGGAPTSLAPPPPPPPPPPPKPPQRIRVGGNVQRANLIRQVRPRYPALAKQARIQGTVILEAIISKQGSVENLRVVKGHPLLIQSALDAVKQWRYKPTVLNGVPVEVITRITVNFNAQAAEPN